MDTILASDGVSLAYQTGGRADGRPVILLHGLTGNSNLWSATVSALAPRFRVLGLDLRGHGSSGAGEDGTAFTFDRAATDVIELANALAVERFTLFGHGMGGDIAQLTALAHPGRLEALVLVGCGPGPLAEESGWAATRSRIADVVERDGIEAGWEAYLEAGLLGYALEDVPREILDAWREQFVRTAAPAFVGFARASAAQADRTEALATLDLPTMVVVGDDDAAFLHHARALSAAIAGGELVHIPGGGHSPQITRADEFNEAVLLFLKRALPSSRA